MATDRILNREDPYDLLRVPTARKIAGVSRPLMARAIAKGELITIKIDDVVFIHRTEVEDWMQRRPRKYLSTDDIAELRHMFNVEGFSRAKIARETGHTRETVSKYVGKGEQRVKGVRL